MRRPDPNRLDKDDMAREELLSTIRSEIEERLAELRPLLAEHEQLLAAAAALEAHEPVTPGGPRRVGRPRAKAARVAPPRPKQPRSRRTPSKQPRAVRGAAREAILAALGHGSHTIAELSVVTAMSGPNIRNNLSRLLAEGAIAKTEREGKLAYALPG